MKLRSGKLKNAIFGEIVRRTIAVNIAAARIAFVDCRVALSLYIK